MVNFIESDPIGLVGFITANLVQHKNEVEINSVQGPQSLVLELHLNQQDLGKIIGKDGRIAKAIRVLLNSISSKKVINEEGTEENLKKFLLEIIDH